MRALLAICRTTFRLTTFGLALFCANVALACPTCKDSLTENYVQAYGMSIVFMMSMPFIIFGALSAYFYYEVRKARRQQQADQSAADPSPESQRTDEQSRESQSRDRWSRESLESATSAKA